LSSDGIQFPKFEKIEV